MRFETKTETLNQQQVTNPIAQSQDQLMVMSPEEVVQNDVAKVREELKNAPQVIQISKEVDVNNPNSILEFGKKPAEEISKYADSILNTVKSNSLSGSSEMLKNLSKILSKFDKAELDTKEQGFIAKLFDGGQKAVDKLLSKYQTIGGEIEKINVGISNYEKDLKNNNVSLEQMYLEIFNYYKTLEMHIVAGNMVIEEMEREDLPYFADKAKSGDQMAIVQYENVKNVIEMFKQRIYSLEMAKMVALQTAPQIKMIAKGNYKLIAKIHDAFIVTIPIFKIALIEAVNLKQQKLIGDSMSAIDETTNALLLRNAENVKNQSMEIARMAGRPSVSIETIEKNLQTIMEGIQATEQIEEENKRAREEGIKKLHSITATIQNSQKK